MARDESEQPKMRGVKPQGVRLKKRDQRELEEIITDGSTPQRIARRARILLGCAKEERVVELVEKTELNSSTVWRVCERYRQGGLEAALYDAGRSGRPQVFPPKHPQSHRKSGL